MLEPIIFLQKMVNRRLVEVLLHYVAALSEFRIPRLPRFDVMGKKITECLVLVLWSKCSRKALPVFSPLPLPWFITNIKFMFPCTSRVERTINKTTLFTLSKPDSAQLICSSSRCHHHSVPVSLSSVYSNLDCFYARPC